MRNDGFSCIRASGAILKLIVRAKRQIEFDFPRVIFLVRGRPTNESAKGNGLKTVWDMVNHYFQIDFFYSHNFSLIEKLMNTGRNKNTN